MNEPSNTISYSEMCNRERPNLQRGMNFHLSGDISLLLMSLRPNAPYSDRIEDDGRALIYEGHDIPKTEENPTPKTIDQPMRNKSGTLTQNGLFYEAAQRLKSGKARPELVKVYEKIRPGRWAYKGIFKLVDAWQEDQKDRKVFKFKLQLAENLT